MVEGRASWTPLKPTRHLVTSPNGVSVILKLLNRGDRELDFLRYLSDIKEPANHTPPLLDVINLNVGKRLIALPWRSRLDEALRFHEHLDTTSGPRSKSMMNNCQLFIIDFDLAEFVESETMIEGRRGTRTWIAPEVGTKERISGGGTVIGRRAAR